MSRRRHRRGGRDGTCFGVVAPALRAAPAAAAVVEGRRTRFSSGGVGGFPGGKPRLVRACGSSEFPGIGASSPGLASGKFGWRAPLPSLRPSRQPLYAALCHGVTRVAALVALGHRAAGGSHSCQ